MEKSAGGDDEDDGPPVSKEERPYMLEDKGDWAEIWGQLGQPDKKRARRFIVPCPKARPLACYANHAFTEAMLRDAALKRKAAQMGLDIAARANAEFGETTFADSYLGQFPCVRLTRDLKKGDEVLVSYGDRWSDVIKAQ